MSPSDTTHWSLIQRAAGGEAVARADFVRRYEPVIRAYLGARWRASPLRGEADDAAQEVFLACLKENGALGRAEPVAVVDSGPICTAWCETWHGARRNVWRRRNGSRTRGWT